MKVTNNSSLIVSIVISLLLLQGCAGAVKMTKEDRAGLKNLKDVKAVHILTGSPVILTPLGVVMSDITFGLSKDWSEGQKLIHKFKIKNPSMLVKESFLKNVKKSKVAKFNNVKQGLYGEDNSIEALKAKYKSGVVLNVKPLTWSIMYYPFNWARYQMLYRAQAELISLDDSKVLWSANCKAYQDNSDTAPTFDQLTSDGSTVLKKWVDDSTRECAKQLVANFLQ